MGNDSYEMQVGYSAINLSEVPEVLVNAVGLLILGRGARNPVVIIAQCGVDVRPREKPRLESDLGQAGESRGRNRVVCKWQSGDAEGYGKLAVQPTGVRNIPR